MSNLEYIWRAIFEENDLESLRTSNFTTIRSMKNVTLNNRIERDFDCYFKNILLELEENSSEDASAILEVIGHDSVELDDIQFF